MTDRPDFYRLFRHPAYNSHQRASATRIAGQFDPMNGVVYLDKEIAAALSTGGTLPTSSVELAGSPVLLDFSTYFHEMIHWWQHIGTTCGLVYGLSIPTQALVATKYLSEVGATLSKPLLHQNILSLPIEHPGRLAVHRWIEIEHGATLLFDPESTGYKLRGTSLLYQSLGHALLLLQISTIAGIARILDPEYHGLPDATKWIDYVQAFARDGKPCFTPHEIIVFPIGMRHIVEGQARLSEIQYRSLTYTPMTWSEVKANALLEGVYGTAFDEYLRLSGQPEPSDPNGEVVNLFLLLCDIALNPAQGYPEDVCPDGSFVQAVHPGIRFMKLCRLVAGDTELVRMVRVLSRNAYSKAAGRLCERAGWLTPVEVAARIVERIDRMSGYNELAQQRINGDFASTDVPIRFYMAEHREFMDTKANLPHLVCWPAAFLTGDDSKTSNSELAFVQQVLDWHRPPFLTSALDAGVDAIQVNMPPDKMQAFANDYFATQVLYDLARQWISGNGQFVLKYRWKPSISDAERVGIERQFEQAFGVSYRSISS